MSKNNLYDECALGMMDFAVKYIKKVKRTPTLELLKDVGYTREQIRSRFGSLEGLINSVRDQVESFIFFEDDFLNKNDENLYSSILKHKRFVITSAQTNAPLNHLALNAIKNYSKRMNAQVLIIPIGNDWTQLDPSLKGQVFVTEHLDLNKNLTISPVQLNSKSINPAASLSRIGARSKSVVYGAAKLSKEVVATPGKHPHLVITTGSITKESYLNDKRYYYSKNEWLASNEHEYSAVVVEIVDDTYFHQRELMFDADGSFVDMSPSGAIRYYPNGSVTKENALALSVGDWHSGETSETAYEQFPKLSKLSGAKMTILHDVFSYGQISHHDNGKEITKIKKAEKGLLNFKNEITRLAEDLRMWQKFSNKILIAESNHDKHLDQNIENGNFWADVHNRRYYLELALAMVDGQDPLRVALEKYAKFDFKNVEFVGPTNQVILESKFGTLNLSSHGHEGGNGHKKAGPKALLQSLGAAVTGHTHSPAIVPGGGNGGLWVNGTSTCTDGEEVPDYARGNVASSWLKTSTLIFQRGKGRLLRQQITLLGDGKWHLDQGKVKNVDDKVKKSVSK